MAGLTPCIRSDNIKTLTQSELKRLLHYDPDTGDFTWLVNKGSRGKVGAVAGCKHGYTGYIDMLVNTKRYPAHRLVFLYMEGSLPAKHVDHINGIRDDNRWCNVRHATPIINHQNRRQQDNNVSGVTGLSWLKKEERWQVQITYNRKTIHLGIFACKLDAAATRFRANKKYGFHENHGRLV